MIVFGSRMYFKKNVVKSFEECEHCGVYGKMISYKARKFGHIYFIPLIPMGKSSQVLRECKKCKRGFSNSCRPTGADGGFCCRSIQVIDRGGQRGPD